MANKKGNRCTNDRRMCTFIGTNNPKTQCINDEVFFPNISQGILLPGLVVVRRLLKMYLKIMNIYLEKKLILSKLVDELGDE